MATDMLEKLLTEMLEEVRLLTVQTKAEAQQKFCNEFLNTESRKQMYGAFDGDRTFQQISEDIGCKLNTLQIFAQSLVEKDLVSFETRGKSRIISKSVSKIATYYARRVLDE